MQVNNETGVRQPIVEVSDILRSHPAFLHVDAAQGFGKDLAPLRDARIDLISASGHKIHGPKGIGVLVARRRRYDRLPLRPLIFGGGQERGLRSGTAPVALIAGLGEAARLALRDSDIRQEKCIETKRQLLECFSGADFCINGDPDFVMDHVLNLSIDGIDSEAFMLQTKRLIAVSNGSACTSQRHQPSHVLEAMGLSENEIAEALRFSWCHLTPQVDFQSLRACLPQIGTQPKVVA